MIPKKSNIQAEVIPVQGHYVMTCTDADGKVKWVEEFDNLVTNVGKAYLLNTFFSGSAYTAAWYMGLITATGFTNYNAADTMSSHAGWTESTYYSLATRPTVTWGSATATGGGAGSAGTGSIATTTITFNINSTDTLTGAFLTTNSTKGGTTGTLFSASSFTGGTRSVISGDVVSVVYTVNC